MQLSSRALLLCLVALLSILASHVDARPGPTAVAARQDATSASSSTATSSSASPSASSSSSPSTTTVAPTSSALSSSSATSTLSSASSTSTPSPTASGLPDSNSALPIQPTITPAFGIAGVILILTGTALALVGVRSKFLHIFESSALLVALAIVVLLVYVANPPVSDAIEGAYLVAAFVPACILGGLALIFKDLLEGLGCMLGGFCLSMWFLVLKSGGLITSNGGRVGLIVALTLAGYSLSFTHYTRHYALIGCLAFSGSTVAILGVDCFSCVGLKEFWIYLWNLNENLFPLDTNTYPLTRGIIVEIACILVLTLFGVMSQLKLWNVIREKRQKRNAARAAGDEDRQALDAGNKNLLSRNDNEISQWAAMYDGKNQDSYFTSAYPSGHPSAQQTARQTQRNSRESEDFKVPSISVKDYGKEVVAVEMSDLSNSRSQSTAAASSNGENPFASTTSLTEHSRPSTARSSEHQFKGVPPVPTRPMRYVARNDDEEGQWVPVQEPESDAAGSPGVVPLPFTTPAKETVKAVPDSDANSLATAGDNEHIEELESVGESTPARFSRARLPNAQVGRDIESPFGDGDDGSSVVATIDGLSDDGMSDLPELSRSGTPMPDLDTAEDTADETQAEAEEEAPALRRVQSASSLEAKGEHDETAKAEAPEASRRHSVQIGQPLPLAKNDILADFPPRKGSSTDSASILASTKPTSEGSRRSSRRSSTKSREAPKRIALTRESLPANPSETISRYFTNEWAKYAADAEALHQDDIAPPSEGGVSVTWNQEAPAPVNVESLQQDAFTPQPPAPSRAPSQLGNRNPYNRSNSATKRATFDTSPNSSPGVSRNNSMVELNRQAAQNALHHRPVSRANSLADVGRSSSQLSLQKQATMNRSVSLHGLSPYMSQTIVESPVEDMPDEAEQAMQMAQPPPLIPHSETLMAKRQTLLNQRMSAVSLATNTHQQPARHSAVGLISQAGNTQPGFSPENGATESRVSVASQPMPMRRRSTMNPDEMTLSQRASVLKLNNPNPMQRSVSMAQDPSRYRRSSTSSVQLPQRAMSTQFTPLVTPDNRLSMMNAINDSHQPRNTNTTTDQDRANRAKVWREAMPENVNRITPVDTTTQGRKQEMLRRAWAADGTTPQEMVDKEKRERAMFMRMGQADMNALHRQKMAQMQAKVGQK